MTSQKGIRVCFEKFQKNNSYPSHLFFIPAYHLCIQVEDDQTHLVTKCLELSLAK